jgi:uncharacterized protein (DUF2141 family)
MRTRFIGLILILTACGSSVAHTPPAPAERARIARATSGELTLDVRVIGLRSERGQVLVALFASERGFPGDGAQAARTTREPISGGRAEARFSGLAAGTYAVAVLHDENANRALDTGFLGIPSEGLGASNDAQGRFSAADWSEASFSLDADRTIEIDVRYFP